MQSINNVAAFIVGRIAQIEKNTLLAIDHINSLLG